MSAIVTLHAQPDEVVAIRWEGEVIPVLYLAGSSIHVSRLGADLGPWLLALSDQLAEFATTVTPEGTRVPSAVSA